MNIYYLDFPLTQDEYLFVSDYLAENENLQDLDQPKQIRVPSILPSNIPTINSDSDLNKVTALLMRNLNNCGLNKDAGKQVVWVMPKEPRWGTHFQLAIERITGYMPYVAQRWYYDDDDTLVRGDLRIIDGHGAMYGK